VVLEVRSERGVVGLGEAAPLPGLSLDTLADAARAIAGFALRAPFELADREAARDIATAAAGAASARFAIETALLDALARDRGVSIAALLGASPASVALAAVVDDARTARRAADAGIRCFKIKLAAGDDPGRVLAIAAAVPGARLRIDANQSWPRAEVVARLARLAGLPIDYVEEPCTEAHRLLGEPLALPLALDESLAALPAALLRAALHRPQLAAVVLKPTLLGGLSACLALAELARAAGVAAVASHGLEGPIGTAACAELALALGDAHPAGLAPHAALAGWSLAVPQLAADHVRPAAAPGLGWPDLDLAAVLGAVPADR
jgi:o-succinylbenzoate synthase